MTKIVPGKFYILKNTNHVIQASLDFKIGVPTKCINCIEEGTYLGVFFEGQKSYNNVIHIGKMCKIWFFPKEILEKYLEEVKVFFQEEFEI